MRIFWSALVTTALIHPNPTAAQDSGERVPVVAAGMEWGVDYENCQLTTPVEGNSMYESLTLTNRGVGDAVSNYQLMLDEQQMRMPEQVTLLANGHEPIAMPVTVPRYGPAGAIWFTAEGGNQELARKMDAGETVMLFTVFEMISLSPYGYADAKVERRACLRNMMASIGLELEEFEANDGAVPDGDVRGVFRVADYPARAIAKGEQGTVRATLVIDTQGKAKKCLVYRSSGSKLLDKTTCDVMLDRAKFKPAMSDSGEPTPSLYIAPPIRWEI